MENQQAELYMEACRKKKEFEYQLFRSLKNFLKIYSRDIHFSTMQERYLFHKLMVLLEEQIAMRKKVLEYPVLGAQTTQYTKTHENT